ncbi:MAG: hypothetical protein EOO90_12705 [Pedobacter sp.]|nr:MAG: hypothetical protein EOO90_12705 [Pedobacter sp.]
MKRIFYIILSVFALQPAFAQTNDETKGTEKPMSLQISAGTTGIGANFRYVLNNTVGLRAGGSFAQGGINDKVNFEGFNSKNRLSGKLNTIHGLVELMPQRFFRVVAGVAYLVNAEANLYFEPKDAQSFNEITLTPEEIGALDFFIDWGKFAPYLGIGLGKGIPTKKFNVNIDLGAYYLSSPKVTAVGTKLLSNNQENAATIQNNMKDYRFMPVAQLNFNFKF